MEINNVDTKSKPIADWYICGTLTAHDDSVLSSSLFPDIQSLAEMQNPDTLNPFWYNGTYKPLYNMLDLSEIYNLDTNEKKHSIEDMITYMACDIASDKDADMYLCVNKQMKCYQKMNGESLHRIEVQGKSFYPVHLNSGLNRYVVKAIAKSNDYSFESTVLDSISVAKIYVNGQSNNIVLPEINADNTILQLTNEHCQLLNTPVKLDIYDVKGTKVYETVLTRGKISYKVDGMQNGHSYMCKMTIAGQSVRQPIVCGSFDDIYARLKSRVKSLAPDSREYDEATQIMYRLEYLLRHETRTTDWWWQFKIAPLTYQIELLCDEDIKNKSEHAFNIQFKTYRSALDGGIQRYLLAVPNEVRQGKAYPLVIVVRPEVENHHHFFTSPQFTHQWAINIMQELANTHDMIVVLPEARMYHSEDVVPFANAEMKLTIEDIKQYYKIDESKMYLHGICSGGYRAMHLATENPGMFAAIGLYAPTYHERKGSEWEQAHSVSTNLHKLTGTPVMIFADPYDRHNPYRKYAGLIDGCNKNNVPLTFTQKINTELLYNCVVVGKEAFDFFDDKQSHMSPRNVGQDKLVISKLYESPFVYVYNSANTSASYRRMVDVIRNEYEDYFFTEMPLMSDLEVGNETLSEKNIFLIGDHFKNEELSSMIKDARINSPASFDENLTSLSIHENKRHEGRTYVIYHKPVTGDYLLRYPWINGTEQIMMK